jgi:hypothetical protein
MGAIAYLTEQLARMQIFRGNLRVLQDLDLTTGDNGVDARSLVSQSGWTIGAGECYPQW